MTTTDYSDLSQAAPRAQVGPLLRLALMVAVLCVAKFDTLASMVDIWWNTTTYNHGFLVAPASLYLVWRRREEVAKLTLAPALNAVLILAIFAVIGFVGEISGVNILRHVGFVGALMALVPLCLGWDFARRFRFAILFLAFMVPFGDFLIPALQELTADVSVWLLQLTGVPVYREGLMIELPSGLWEVAEACAGIRFLIANIFIAFVFAYLSYDKAWKWVLFLTLSVAIPVFANCLRAYGIMMLAHLTDNALAVGVDHLVYGWVFFSLVMLLMLWIGGLFADRTIEDPAMRPFAPVAPGTRSNGFAAMVAGALILTGGPALATLTDPVAEPLPTDIAARAIPGGWSALPIDGEAPDRWIPRFGSADKAEMLRLTDGPHVVDVFVAAYSHQRDGAEALHWSNRFDDDTIWKRAGLKTITLDTGETGLPTIARRDDLTYFVQHDNGTDFSTRVVASWVLSGDTFTASAKRAKIAQLRARLTGGTAKAAVVALSAQGEDGIAAIEALLADAPVLDGLLD
jgi:exosortase A